MVQIPKEVQDKVFEAIGQAKLTGKIKKGTNEVTKAIERGVAKLVVIASDTTPKEIIMHIPLLSKEKKIPCAEVSSKDELGAAAGLDVSTSAIAIINEGEAKKLVSDLSERISELDK